MTLFYLEQELYALDLFMMLAGYCLVVNLFILQIVTAVMKHMHAHLTMWIYTAFNEKSEISWPLFLISC